MRSCLSLLGLVGALLLDQMASAQNVITNNTRTASAPVATPVASGPSSVNAVGVTISADSKLIPGDEVSILIEEDKEPAWKTYVTDAGEVDFPTRINGRPAAFSWRLGDGELAHWHYQGEDQRRPIPTDWKQGSPLTHVRLRGQGQP